jgi:phage regulator Rha-like protein
LQAVFFWSKKMQIAKIDSTQTMSSREIAELVESRHDSVKRSMETLRDKGVIRFTQEVATSHDGAGARPVEVYMVGKRDSYIVVAQLSPEFTARLVDRWQELEEQQAIKVPTTLSGALRLAAEQAEQIEAKDALLLEQAPKVAIYEILADRKQDVSTTLIAKQLGTTAIKLNQFLREGGVKWLNADLPKAGYSEWFNVVSDVKNGHEFHQCLITPLGQIEITKLWTAK